ncbi:MAG: LysR family transcriptional regulator [Nannocystaceae bacterium]
MAFEDIQIGDLRILIEVVERKGFTAAGKRLGRSTKQMSRQVARLEDRVGKRLLSRTTHSVSLTAEGREFVEHARAMLAAAELAEASLFGRLEPERTRTLRVAVPTLDFGVGSWIAELRKSYPNTEFEVSVSDFPLDLARLGLDLQLVVSRPSQTSFVVRRLSELRAVLAARQSYLDVAGAPGRPEDLSDHACLLWGSQEPQLTWELRGSRRSVEVPVGRALVSDSSSLLLGALVEGVGIGVCGRAWFSSNGREHDLVRVLKSWEPVPAALYVVFPGPGRRPELAEAFIDLARRSVAEWY